MNKKYTISEVFEALEFYSKVKNWEPANGAPAEVEMDGGMVARHALAYLRKAEQAQLAEINEMIEQSEEEYSAWRKKSKAEGTPKIDPQSVTYVHNLYNNEWIPARPLPAPFIVRLKNAWKVLKGERDVW